MTLLAYETFLDDVLPELPGCSVELALHHIRRTINDFGAQTRYLTTWLPTIDVLANIADYSIVPTDSDKQLIRPEEVRYLGDEIDPADVDELNAKIPRWRTDTGVPYAYLRENETDIHLVYIPSADAAAALQVKVSYTPDFAASGFDSVFYNKYADGIAAGVKARLMKMVNKPWSAPQLVDGYTADFKKEIMEARQAADKANSRARRRTRTYYR